MEIHLSPDQEARLGRVAIARDCDTETVAQEAISRFLDEETRFVEAVMIGEAELNRGEFITHEEMGQRLEKLFVRE